MNTYALGGGKARRPAVAPVGVALHEPFDLAGMNAEFVLQDATRPDRPGLLIFRNADALAAKIRWRGDPGVVAHNDAGVKKLPHGENRNPDPARLAPRYGNDQRRHRHFGNVELGKAQLAPEHFRGVDHGRNEPDPLRRNPTLDERARALVVGERNAQPAGWVERVRARPKATDAHPVNVGSRGELDPTDAEPGARQAGSFT